jgi:hypothetical protein
MADRPDRPKRGGDPKKIAIDALMAIAYSERGTPWADLAAIARRALAKIRESE